MTLTAKRLKELLTYNPEIGLFRRNSNGKISEGGVSKYISIYVDGRSYYAHRLAWLYMTGEWPKEFIDHKDMDQKNNKWGNLREANQSQNQANRVKKRNSKSGYKGICWHKRDKRWRATIIVNKKRIHLGDFISLDLAAEAYKTASINHFGEYARYD